jgi:hypothetical protein
VKKLIAIMCVVGAGMIAATAGGTPQTSQGQSSEAVTEVLKQRIEGAVTLDISVNGQTTQYSRDEAGSYGVLLNTPDPQAPHPVLEFRLLNKKMYARGVSEKLKQGEWLDMTALLEAWPTLPDVMPPSVGEYNYMAWLTQDVAGHFEGLSDVVYGFAGVTPAECFSKGGVSKGATNKEWRVDCKIGTPPFDVMVDENSRVMSATNKDVKVLVSYTAEPVVPPAKSEVLTTGAAKKKLG